MRLLLLLSLTCLSAGCGKHEDYVIRSHQLTAAQSNDQERLLKRANLPLGYQTLVGSPVAPFQQLLPLANETRTRSNEVMYIFAIPGVGDGGTTGTLMIAVSGDKIVRTAYSYPDW